VERVVGCLARPLDLGPEGSALGIGGSLQELALRAELVLGQAVLLQRFSDIDVGPDG